MSLSPAAGAIEFADFLKLDIRAGTILTAAPFPAARTPAYQLTIDFGPLGTRQSSAQLTVNYTTDSLIRRQVLAVVNLAPKRVAGFKSEVLVLGLPDANGAVVLVRPATPVADGARMY